MTGNNTGLVLQDRDRHLLRELAVMRVIDREQAKLVAEFGSTTRANARLLALTRTGLLRRFFLGTTTGGKKAIYALSPSGARLLDLPCRGPRRKREEVLVGDFFVTHQLAINEIYGTLKYRPLPTPEAKFLRWMSYSRPLDPGGSLIPDGYVELLLSGKPLAAFLEIDLGHEGQKIWKAKIEAYLRYAASGQFATRFHQPRFRVLVVGKSARRAESIRNLAGSVTEKIFWFSSFEQINREGFWSPVWLRPRDDRGQSLL
jgi:hypothetical protein